MQYSEMFKRKMIQKMTGPGALSASALARQEEPSHGTLPKWLRKAGVQSPYVYPNKAQEDAAMPKSLKTRHALSLRVGRLLGASINPAGEKIKNKVIQARARKDLKTGF
jgi:transposase-like protein